MYRVGRRGDIPRLLALIRALGLLVAANVGVGRAERGGRGRNVSGGVLVLKLGRVDEHKELDLGEVIVAGDVREDGLGAC